MASQGKGNYRDVNGKQPKTALDTFVRICNGLIIYKALNKTTESAKEMKDPKAVSVSGDTCTAPVSHFRLKLLGSASEVSTSKQEGHFSRAVDLEFRYPGITGGRTDEYGFKYKKSKMEADLFRLAFSRNSTSAALNFPFFIPAGLGSPRTTKTTVALLGS
jgi:hypothetical protein